MTATGFSRGPLVAALAMAVIVAASNVAVSYPIAAFGLADYLTWGAFTYPFAFLVTDLTNRAYGPRLARRVVAAGFVVAVLASVLLAGPRIAVASGAAFLAAQLLDIRVFDGLRRDAWWKAPFVSSVIGSGVDTALFFTLAFAGTTVPWMSLAVVDWGVKLALAALFLAPYGWLRGAMPLAPEEAGLTPRA